MSGERSLTMIREFVAGATSARAARSRGAPIGMNETELLNSFGTVHSATDLKNRVKQAGCTVPGLMAILGLSGVAPTKASLSTQLLGAIAAARSGAQGSKGKKAKRKRQDDNQDGKDDAGKLLWVHTAPTDHTACNAS